MNIEYRPLQFGNENDYEQALGLTQRLLADGEAFKNVPLDYDTMRATLMMASDPDHTDSIAIAAFDEDTLVGGIIGMAAQSFFSRAKVAEDLGLFVAPEVRTQGVGQRLIEHFILWAQERNVARVTLGNSAGMDDKAFTGLLGANGFSRAGSLMYLDI